MNTNELFTELSQLLIKPLPHQTKVLAHLQDTSQEEIEELRLPSANQPTTLSVNCAGRGSESDLGLNLNGQNVAVLGRLVERLHQVMTHPGFDMRDAPIVHHPDTGRDHSITGVVVKDAVLNVRGDVVRWMGPAIREKSESTHPVVLLLTKSLPAISQPDGPSTTASPAGFARA